jgi:hypothetical protein
MKPKNRFQKQVMELSKQLPTITSKQEQWARRYCFEHIAKKNSKGVFTCLECGHKWTDKSYTANIVVCPCCKTTLEVKRTRQQVFKQSEYFCIVTTFKGYQVLRFFYLNVYKKEGQQAHFFCREVVQRWINPQGKYATLALIRMSYYRDKWVFSSDLEIRKERELHDIMPTKIYPRYRILPEIKRNGFKGVYHDNTPFRLFHSILTNNRMETLLKAGQYGLLRYFIRTKGTTLDHYWTSIRICIRNHYTIEDGSMWCDYVNMLTILGKDTNCPKYVCPIDLKAEHNRRHTEILKQREKEEQEQRKRKAMEQEQRFREMKAKFFGIAFTDGTINIRVLESVQEYLEEGNVLHHCVFTNEYYIKPNSLILSATISGKRLETIEVSLETMKVIQCRGLCNQNTEYHDQIINLVHRNMKQIRQRMAV